MRQAPFDPKNKPKLAFMLKEVEFIHLNYESNNKPTSEVGDVLTKIKEYLRDGFFFGFNFDLTRSC